MKFLEGLPMIDTKFITTQRCTPLTAQDRRAIYDARLKRHMADMQRQSDNVSVNNWLSFRMIRGLCVMHNLITRGNIAGNRR